jgi:predicted oxidoreductase
MKTLHIGKTGMVTTRMAYGCMGIAYGWEPEKVTEDDKKRGRKAVIAAWEAGYRLFDHADIYCAGMCESIFAGALKEVPEMRREILVSTKCGIIFGGNPSPDSPGRYDFSANHIMKSCELSLKRLGIETIDIYHLHRPDILMDPDEVLGAFTTLYRQGKVRSFAVSNFLPSTVEALQSRLPWPLAANQVEIHPGRLDCFVDGTLDQCLTMGMTPLAWSPLGGGRYANGEGNDAKDRNLIKVLDATAKNYGVSRGVLTLAWLMRHPAKIIPLVGSANPKNILEMAKADEVEVAREDWYRIYVAARGEEMP